MSSKKAPEITQIPRHIAIVMDGNGRWAKRRLMPRGMGHKAGVDALVRVVRSCSDRGVEFLTVFAFSSENWKRPKQEVTGLMSLLIKALSKHIKQLSADGVQVRVVGDLSSVSSQVRDALLYAQSSTAHNSKLVLTVAFNYGGRWDIVQATQQLLAKNIKPELITEAMYAEHLSMSFAPDPDLLIRTGGELRLSNFLLWQSAYCELFFIDCLWPDFDETHLNKGLEAYAHRDRRFGDVRDSGNRVNPA